MATRVDAGQRLDELDRRTQALLAAVIETSVGDDPLDRKAAESARLGRREAETRITLRRRRTQASIVHVSQRRENVARPRERRPTSRRRTATRAGPDDSGELPEPDELSATWRGLQAASVRLQVHLERRSGSRKAAIA